MAWVSYTNNGVAYRREIIASHPDQVIAMHLTASQAGRISFTASFACGHWWADLAPVEGSKLGPFDRRADALGAEVEWLRAHWLLA